MGKTGRNERCPCGSGRKFKHCCGAAGSNILPFPSRDDAVQDPASDVIGQLKKDIGDRVFDSEEQLRSFVSDWNHQQSEAPIDDFLGLSPEQMSGILYRPLEGQQDFLRLRPVLSESDVRDIPLVNQALWLLRFLRDDGPIKLTAAGYVPPKAAMLWYRECFAPYMTESSVEIQNFRRESDDMDMERCREILKDLKWTTLRKGVLSLSARGRDAMEMDINDIYRVFFYHLADERDWETRDAYRFPVDPFLQRSLGFYIHLLHTGVKGGISYRDFAGFYFRAFPHHYEGYEEEIIIHLDVSMTAALRFTRPMGLTSAISDRQEDEDLVPTDLFRRVIEWM